MEFHFLTRNASPWKKGSYCRHYCLSLNTVPLVVSLPKMAKPGKTVQFLSQLQTHLCCAAFIGNRQVVVYICLTKQLKYARNEAIL